MKSGASRLVTFVAKYNDTGDVGMMDTMQSIVQQGSNIFLGFNFLLALWVSLADWQDSTFRTSDKRQR